MKAKHYVEMILAKYPELPVGLDPANAPQYCAHKIAYGVNTRVCNEIVPMGGTCPRVRNHIIEI